MLNSHELFGFMSPQTANAILEYTYQSHKPVYKSVLAAIADARKLRPAFYEKKPRAERHREMLEMLSRPRMEAEAGNLLRTWLVNTQAEMLAIFLDCLNIPHKAGVVEDLPDQLDDARLQQGISKLLERFPQETVVIYLNAFCSMNPGQWTNLEQTLKHDERLQLA